MLNIKNEIEILLEGTNCCEDFEWDDLNIELTNLMEKIQEKINCNFNWHVEVENFGWNNMNGCKEFKAKTGKELLHNILPNTECHFKIYNYCGNKKGALGLSINNSHHDKPCGGEWYHIIACQE